MPSLPPPPPLAQLIDAHRITLFLDFDGTLTELAPGPEEVRIDPALPPLLERLAQRLDGRLAIVSGRSVDWLSEAGFGEHILSGTHGGELSWPGKPVERTEPPASLREVNAAFDKFAATRPGIIVERKPLAAGLHFRKAPEHGSAAEALAAELAQQTGLAVQPGKMMVELRLPGGSKGTAVHALMGREPFTGSMPIFPGDDVTDEEGFLAATEHSGFGIAVGERESVHARYHLPGVQQVHRWLKDGAGV